MTRLTKEAQAVHVTTNTHLKISLSRIVSLRLGQLSIGEQAVQYPDPPKQNQSWLNMSTMFDGSYV